MLARGTTLRIGRRAAMRSCKGSGITVESIRHLLGGTINSGNPNNHVQSMQIYFRDFLQQWQLMNPFRLWTEGEPASPDIHSIG